VRYSQGILLGVSAGVAPAAVAAVSLETGRWVPGLGDPTWFGWLTVFAYLATGGLCLANRALAADALRPSGFWLILAIFLFALALNKQLDLQSWFTQVGRDLAQAQGWYESRRIVQVGFIAALVIGGIVVAFLLRHGLRDSWAAYRVAIVGVIVLMVFIVARAATFHHIDRLIGVQFEGVRLNFVVEMGAIGIVAFGALQWRSRFLNRRRDGRRARRISRSAR
jgi:hypothetical protein